MRNVKKIVKRHYRQAVSLFLIAVMLSYSPMAMALDASDAHVVDPASAGVATAGDITTVTMNDSSAIINWDTLNTSNSETLQFIREAGNFYVLNRVGGGVTQFDGTLLGNQGHIIIVNPAGIVFGPDAFINAAQFTASSLNMSNSQFDDYVNGVAPMVFEDGYGSVINHGAISADKIALIGKKVLNTGSILSENGFILMATGDKVVIGSEGSDVMVEIDPVMKNIEDPEDLGDVINQGTVENMDGRIILAAGDVFSQALEGNEPLGLSDAASGNVRQEGIIAHHDGTLTMSAIDEVALKSGSLTYTNGDIEMSAHSILIEEDLSAGGSADIFAANTVKAINGSELSSGSDMNIRSTTNAVSLSGNVSSGGDLNISSGTYLSADRNLTAADNMHIETEGSNGNDTYAQGSLKAGGNLTLDTNLHLAGGYYTPSDQSVDAENGILKANGWIHKETAGQLTLHGGYDSYSGEAAVKLNEVTNGGNIYIKGNGNVQVKGDISAVENVMEFLGNKDYVPHNKGGVSIISENGEIYSDSVGIGLDIDITGFSNEVAFCEGTEPMGVDLPYGEGKAAIVLQSKKDLRIGEEAGLFAQGVYIAEGHEPPYSECIEGVDNRPDVDFLDTDAVIGGYERQQGEPIDVAIYAGSTEGDVTVASPRVEVTSTMFPSYNYYGDDDDDDEAYWGIGTVVYDAFDTVEFDFYNTVIFKDPYADTDYYFRGYDYRVEVCSRITEWLNEAIDNETLPFADDPSYGEEMFYGGYVLRGAGVPANGYKQAWVLENEAPIIVTDAAPLPVIEEPALGGCPVQMDTVAAELGINSDELQMAIGSSLALNPNVQPCNACGRLIKASAILKDPDGTRFAALNQIFNNLAPANVPFTAQVSADIVTSFAQMSSEDSRYAMASEYIDAFVEYVAVLDQDLGAPVGNSVAFAMEKHGNAISSSPNGNIGAFLLSRLESFGE